MKPPDRTLPLDLVTKPTISVVIPTKNSARTLAACLQSIRRQTYPILETVVVDNASTDDTVAIARSSGAVVEQGGAERSEQRNIGCKRAAGRWLLVLDADMVLREDVAERCIEAAALGPCAVAIPEESFGVGFWSRCKAVERRCYVADPHTSAARFFLRDDLLRVGGYDEALTGGEDMDCSMRICESSTALLFADTVIYHDEGRQTLGHLFRKKYYYARGIAAFVRKHGVAGFRRFSPARPALFKNLGVLFRDPAIGIGVFVMKTIELIGVLAGLIALRLRPESIYQDRSG